jgi:hypothetical protein
MYSIADACFNGDLNQVKKKTCWRSDAINEAFDFSAKDDDAFNLACIHGHRSIVKLLLNTKPVLRDINTFYFSCNFNGHVDIAKLLWRAFPNVDNEKIQVCKWVECGKMTFFKPRRALHLVSFY